MSDNVSRPMPANDSIDETRVNLIGPALKRHRELERRAVFERGVRAECGVFTEHQASLEVGDQGGVTGGQLQCAAQSPLRASPAMQLQRFAHELAPGLIRQPAERTATVRTNPLSQQVPQSRGRKSRVEEQRQRRRDILQRSVYVLEDAEEPSDKRVVAEDCGQVLKQTAGLVSVRSSLLGPGSGAEPSSVGCAASTATIRLLHGFGEHVALTENQQAVRRRFGPCGLVAIHAHAYALYV